MHFLDPVAKTVHDHAADDRMIRIERVPGAGEIGVAGAVLLEDVVSGVVQSAEAQRRARVVAFRSVVEDHVENDLDACPVQRLDHVAKFVHRAERILTRAIRLVRREERNRRIAPIVDSSRAGNPERRTERPAAVRPR